MLKKYIQLFLESSDLQSHQPVRPSYREIEQQIEDQNRINTEPVRRANMSTEDNDEEMDIEKYKNLVNYGTQPSRRFMFTKKPKNRT